MTLQLGQVVRYENALWRVDFLNDCRARIVLLSKQQVTLTDDEGNVVRSYAAQLRGVNISPNSVLSIVDNPERAADELELAKAERELAQARAELERAQQTPSAREPGDWKPHAKDLGPAPPAGWRWHRIEGADPDCKEGSLKETVLDLVKLQPGWTTKQIAGALEDMASAGAVAACLDRFFKAGVLRRSS